VKIKIERPDAEAARHIFARYLTVEVPLDEDDVKTLGKGDPAGTIAAMIDDTVSAMYATTVENQFLEVTYQNGDREILHYKDFSSGAMIENIVRRAKKLAIKRAIATGRGGVRREDLIASIRQEFREHEDLPNTTNPDDWAKVSGRKGERIVFIRTLGAGASDDARSSSRAIERTATGQYL
jgi:proteasome-associated ATPase